MGQDNRIQVFRYDSRSGADRVIKDIWEIGAGASVNAIVTIVTAAYVDGSDDAYEVLTIVDGATAHTRKLCWDAPPRCRKERVCVVLEEEGRLEDLRAYCVDFFS